MIVKELVRSTQAWFKNILHEICMFSEFGKILFNLELFLKVTFLDGLFLAKTSGMLQNNFK